MSSLSKDLSSRGRFPRDLWDITVTEAPPRLHATTDTESPVDDGDFDLVDYCARPMCRKEFRQSVGRGRRRDYCSETCRRLADRDYKRAKATVEHFERLAERSRHDVRAFGRAADELDGDLMVGADVARERAGAAIARAQAVLQFAGDADPRLVGELRYLLEAVRPALALSS